MYLLVDSYSEIQLTVFAYVFNHMDYKESTSTYYLLVPGTVRYFIKFINLVNISLSNLLRLTGNSH